jgi:hypothetical protein
MIDVLRKTPMDSRGSAVRRVPYSRPEASAEDRWRVRRGRAYQADALHRLTPPDRAVMAGPGSTR